MKNLRWIGLMSSLLIVGVLGGLMAPLPSEAATLTLDGATINVSTSETSCPFRSGFNACYDLVFTSPLTVNNKWLVFDCSAAGAPCGATFTGRAKVDVNDVQSCSGCTSDMLKLGGIGIKLKTPSSTKQSGTLVLRHTFKVNNTSNQFYWAMTEQGWFDPPLSEVVAGLAPNAVGDSVTFTAQARHPSTNALLFSLGGFTKASVVSPTTPDAKVTFGISQTTPQLKGTCDTGGNKCNITAQYTWDFGVIGSDLVVITESILGGGTTCGDTGNIPTCPQVVSDLGTLIGNIVIGDGEIARNAGAVEGQLCQEPCLVIRVRGTPAEAVDGEDVTFSASTVSGGPLPPGIPASFTIKLSELESGELGVGVKAFSNLNLNPPGEDLKILVTGFSGDSLSQVDQVKCSGGGTCQVVYDGSGSSKTKTGFVVTKNNGQLDAEVHAH